MIAYLCLQHFTISFFFNDTSSTEIYTLSLHDALPISKVDARSIGRRIDAQADRCVVRIRFAVENLYGLAGSDRSEEHTSELQSPMYLVCRLLLEKKKNNVKNTQYEI